MPFVWHGATTTDQSINFLFEKNSVQFKYKNKKMQYLRAFVIGSSFAVFVLFFLTVMYSDQKRYS